MKNRIAYNLVTGEVVEAYTNKRHFWSIVRRMELANRYFYGVKGHWIFHLPR